MDDILGCSNRRIQQEYWGVLAVDNKLTLDKDVEKIYKELDIDYVQVE